MVKQYMWAGFGVIVAGIGLLDVFFTILHYDGFGIISSRFYRLFWGGLRWLTDPFPKRISEFWRSLGTPLMIPATLLLWLGLVTVGFACMYYPFMHAEYFSLPDYMGGRAGFFDAIFFSGISLTTVGYGDIVPRNSFFQCAAVVEGLVGFSIITLAISYVLNIYQVVQRMSVMAAELRHESGSTRNTQNILLMRFCRDETGSIEAYMRNLHRNLVAYYESLRHYPITYYFYSRRAYLSIPYVFYTIGGVLASLRWGLPTNQPASQNSSLLMLYAGYSEIINRMQRQFLPHHPTQPIEAVDHETFKKAFNNAQASLPGHVNTFLRLNSRMQDIAAIEPSTVEDAYRRYKNWLQFAGTVDWFVHFTAKELGYSPQDISGEQDIAMV
ncbi:MAG: potassium channel family protein [Chitinivibrionales bacterium]